MKEFLINVKDPMGLHARPASQLFMEARKFNCQITAEMEGNVADVKNILDIMGLGAAAGNQIRFCFDGSDESEAMEAVHQVLIATEI